MVNHSERAHAVKSASSSSRWMACPASAKLAAQYPSKDTVFTLEGTAAHEIAEVCARRTVQGMDVPLPTGEQYNDEMIRHGQAYADYIAGLCKPSTLVLLEQRLDYSPWVSGGFGTGDCVLMTDGVMDVIDYKYGSGVAVSAEGNPQMQLYGLGALNVYEFLYDIERVRLHIFQPRMDNISVWELTVDELYKFGAYAKERSEACDAKYPEAKAGPHCRWCPHAGHCLELTISSLLEVSGEYTVAPYENTLTPDGVARLFSMEPMITAWLKAVKASALDDLLEGKEIPGFKVVEGKLGNRAWSNEQKVAEALDAAGVPKEDYTTLQLLSPAAMDKALGKKKAAELLSGLVVRAPGKPTVVPDTDKRAEYDPANDFTNLEE